MIDTRYRHFMQASPAMSIGSQNMSNGGHKMGGSSMTIKGARWWLITFVVLLLWSALLSHRQEINSLKNDVAFLKQQLENK